ncbi:MAG: hypothetical protein U0798_00220 [Gemmataceae bacterium]
MEKTESIEELVFSAYFLPDGALKITLLERAVALADQSNDVELGFDIRMDLIHTACFANRPDLLLVHFSWCLAKFDENPEAFDGWDLLWRYKWVISNVEAFPEISLKKIESLYADISRRFEAFGNGQRAIWLNRMMFAMHRGCLDEAVEAQKAFQACKRDELSDCKACECDDNMTLHLARKEYDLALKTARPILNGKLSCKTVPQRSYNKLVSYLILDPNPKLKTLAEDVHVKGKALIRGSDHLERMDGHLMYLAFTSRIADAMKLFNRTNQLGLSYVSLVDRFYYLRSSLFLMERVAIEKSRSRPKLHAHHELAKLPARDILPAFTDKLREELRDVANQFDKRNGTKAFASLIDEIREWHEAANRYRESG